MASHESQQKDYLFDRKRNVSSGYWCCGHKKKLGSVLGNFFVIIFISVNLYSFLNIFYYYLF